MVRTGYEVSFGDALKRDEWRRQAESKGFNCHQAEHLAFIKWLVEENHAEDRIANPRHLKEPKTQRAARQVAPV